VPDLSDEMRELATDAAYHARPMAVADVIRRGNHRRIRAITQRSIGGLSAVGLGAAVLFTGTAHHLGSNPAAASGAVSGGNTLTATTTTAAGDLTTQVKYQDEPAGKVRILSVTYSGDLKVPLKKRSLLLFEFGPGLANGKPVKHSVIIAFGALLPKGQHHFSGSISGKHLGRKGPLILPGNGSFRALAEQTVSKVSAVKTSAGKKSSVATATRIKPGLTTIVILTR
jgi:hypothetical protein